MLRPQGSRVDRPRVGAGGERGALLRLLPPVARRTAVHHGNAFTGPERPRRLATRSCLGPVADLEAHLPEEWWRKLFNALYVKTDGDVVENRENTRREVDFIVSRPPRSSRTATSSICAAARAGTAWSSPGAASSTSWASTARAIWCASPRSGRRARACRSSSRKATRATRACREQLRLRCHHGQLVRLLLQQAGRREGPDRGRQDPAPQRPAGARHHRRRPHGTRTSSGARGSGSTSITSSAASARISQDGERLISREVIVHDEMGVIADQFYAERLYTRESIGKLLEKTGFRNVRHHGHAEALSDRDQDLGMMARRILLTADAPQLPVRKQRQGCRRIDVTVVMGDPRLPDQVKRGGAFNPEDLETIRRLQGRAVGAAGLQVPLPRQPRHARARSVGAAHRSGVQPVRRRVQQRPLQGAARPGHAGGAGHCLHGRRALGARRLLRQGARARRGAWRSTCRCRSRRYVRPGDQGATLPSVFPALLKPNHGDSSQGITKDAVVNNEKALLDYLDRLRVDFPKRAVLVQEYPDRRRILGAAHRQSRPGPARAADPRGRLLASSIDKLPKILGYESKWEPDSPYWTQIRYQRGRRCPISSSSR